MGRAAGKVFILLAFLASAQLLEGTGSVIMKDGKSVGSESSGRIVVKFASGTLAAISGKTLKYAVKPLSLNRFQLERVRDQMVLRTFLASRPDRGPAVLLSNR